MSHVTPHPIRLRVLDWTGCFFGLVGAVLLALKISISPYGWIAFLLANVALIAFARGVRAPGLLVQQLGFMVTSVIGLVRAFLTWSTCPPPPTSFMPCNPFLDPLHDLHHDLHILDRRPQRRALQFGQQ